MEDQRKMDHDYVVLSVKGSVSAVGDPEKLSIGLLPGEGDRLLGWLSKSSCDNGGTGEEGSDLVKGGVVVVDCRICQEEDELGNLETPCACSGSLKYAHRKCVQRWCNEKGDTMCEICHHPYKDGYEAPPRQEIPDESSAYLRHPSSDGIRVVSSQRLEPQDSVIRILEAEYEENAIENSKVAACCRSAALILMALLLLRHILGMATSGSEDDTSAFFAFFLLKTAGFLLPCYVIAQAVSILRLRTCTQVREVAEPEVATLVHVEGASDRTQLLSSVS